MYAPPGAPRFRHGQWPVRTQFVRLPEPPSATRLSSLAQRAFVKTAKVVSKKNVAQKRLYTLNVALALILW